MAIPQPNFGSDIRSVTLARWFHKQGIAWSGTPSELVSELANEKLGNATRIFPDADQLAAFVEANAVALSQLSVEASVLRPPGRPRIIRLQALGKATAAERIQGPQLAPKSENASLHPVPSPGTETPVKAQPVAPQPPRPVVQIPRLPTNAPAAKPVTSPAPVLEAAVAEPVEEPAHLLGLTSAGREVEELGIHKLDDSQEEDAVRARYLPLAAAALLLLVIFVAILAFSHGVFAGFAPRRTPAAVANKPVEQPPSSDSAKTEPVDSLMRDLNQKELLREASQTKLPSPQYELGMRYAEGRGVKQDKVAAYAWLVLARTNGSTRCDPMLRTLAGELSPEDVQKVRIKIGKSFAQGVGVAKDNVAAHTWISLAEVAGSAEATILKKRLEAQMTSAQIEEATTRTTAWLSRH